MLSNQGEIHGNSTNGTSFLDGQMAIAITDNNAVLTIVNYAYRTSDSTNNYHKNAMLEGGLV
ncbi:MAG: hypothetical protein PF487_11990 [Bacteroidales bacterium]|jgi:hypothetical protein|nr:hypothetical protein [Bacteroidales bacterium]